jgi:predicted site-specific integrase-resolvase
MQYVSRSKAAEHFGVSGQTIAKRAKGGKLEYFAQPSGQKRYAVRLQDGGHQAQKVC